MTLGIQEQDISTLSSQDVSNATVWEEQQTRHSATIDSMDLGGYKYLSQRHGGTRNQVAGFCVATFPRAEISRVAFHYIAPGSPRGLKLSDHGRAAVLYALGQTAHPSAFTLVKRMLDVPFALSSASELRTMVYLQRQQGTNHLPPVIRGDEYHHWFRDRDRDYSDPVIVSEVLANIRRVGMVVRYDQLDCFVPGSLRSFTPAGPWETAKDNSPSKCTQIEGLGVEKMNVQ